MGLSKENKEIIEYQKWDGSKQNKMLNLLFKD